MPPGERQQLVIFNLQKDSAISLIASWISPNVIKKTGCMSIIVSTKDLFDVSVVLL